MDNNYFESTLEWYAWGLGNDYAQGLAPNPNLLPRDIISAAWKSVLGDSWDTYTDGTPDDRDADHAILDAWSEGANAYWGQDD